ncbi:hypothetical protein VF21_03571 [Pseudogymnoascus sp. 05NY08]|nr:hypothetical protein VF21_03571 [Pseudogymnoascus sp. 05NY08]
MANTKKPLGIDIANAKSLPDFTKDYLPTDTPWTSFTHPGTEEKYTIELQNSSNLTRDELSACFSLVEESSKGDYSASKQGWKPAAKRREMRLLELKYLLVRSTKPHDGEETGKAGDIEAFVSFMPTIEDEQEVLYVYEIHLAPSLRRSGLGRRLMMLVEDVARRTGVEKVMLSCFTRNAIAKGFYEGIGYRKDEYSPLPRVLRDGREVEEATLAVFLDQGNESIPDRADPKSEVSGTTPNDADPLKVIVIGAGIGGLALAQILHSTPGIRLACYERYKAIDDRVVGFRVMLSGTTLLMLKRKLKSDIWAELAFGIGEQPEGGEKIEFFKGNGNKMLAWDSDPTKDQFSVSRWHLREALVKEASFVRTGISFERYEVLPNGRVRAFFSDGSTDECDLLVGADGTNSNVRKQLLSHATIKDLGMAVIYFKNPLAPFSSRYNQHTIDPEDSYIMLGAGSPYANFSNRRCSPNELTPSELQAEVLARTSQPGIHPRFRELAEMVCLDTAYVNIVRKSEAVHPWTSSPNITLLGDAVFNMSNTLSRGANCAIMDAAALADRITSPAYRRELRQPAALDDYVRENIERRDVERQRSAMMQKIMFSGQNKLRGFIRNKVLPSSLKKIDDLDREEHDGVNWVGSDGEGSVGSTGEEPKWVEELKWDEIFEERHGHGTG